MYDRSEYDETAARMDSITAAELIGDFMRGGLPIVAWTIAAEHDYDGTGPDFPTLTGICHAKTGREDVIRAYGEHLGAELRDPHRDGQYVDVVAELRGVWVRLWARRDAR